MSTKDRTHRFLRPALLVLSIVTLGGCASSQQRGAAVDPPRAATPEEGENKTNTKAGAPDRSETDRGEEPRPENGEKPKANGENGLPANGAPSNGEPANSEPANGDPAKHPNRQASNQPTPGQPPVVTSPSPWTLFTRVRNGYSSNIDFNPENTNTYGGALITGVGYEGDDIEFSYEIAGHSYTNSNRWDRVSHVLSASYELPFPGKWDFELEGTVGFKGSSEDRDIVDQDIELSPRLEYMISPERRLRFYSKHRLKRYEEAPDTNAFKNYVGLEFLEFISPRRYFEFGARYETNDERRDRSDSIRWTYSVQHAIPVTQRDLLVLNVRYRLKRYPKRFVEIEDEDVLRVDHRWSPAIAWVRTVGKVDLSFDYGYETSYSNDPEKAYKAHMAFTSIGYRWR